jgi:hypothetical protein
MRRRGARRSPARGPPVTGSGSASGDRPRSDRARWQRPPRLGGRDHQGPPSGLPAGRGPARRWTMADEATCLHEAGHVVAAHLLGRKVVWITVEPGEYRSGCCRHCRVLPARGSPRRPTTWPGTSNGTAPTSPTGRSWNRPGRWAQARPARRSPPPEPLPAAGAIQRQESSASRLRIVPHGSGLTDVLVDFRSWTHTCGAIGAFVPWPS